MKKKNNFPSKIAVIGVGLIGGSIALGLKQHFGSQITILGACSTTKRSKSAQRQGVIDETIDLYAQSQGLRSADLIILATPVSKTIKLLKTISKINVGSSLIIDVGSTKESVLNSAKKLLDANVSFMGTHPMAGSEMSGFENANPSLFRNKSWIVCNDRLPTDKSKFTILKELIDILGAKIMIMPSKKHDQLVSWASHLNLVSSSIIIKAIGKHKDWSEIAKIASTGFRDTTRLASSDVGMKKDILISNKKNIIETLYILKNEIDLFIKLANKKDSIGITNYLSEAKFIRDEWIANYFS